MPCNCNAHEDRNQPGPLDQCLLCALKHWDAAYNAHHEFHYDRRNRDWVRSNIKAIISHTYRQWPAIADLCRDLWHILAENKDATNDISRRLLAIGDAIEDALDIERMETTGK